MTLQLHRPDGKGGIEPRQASDQNWRRTLRSSRWGSGNRRGHLTPLANPEMNPTRTAISVGFWLFLAVLTFVLLVAGYGSGFWR